MGIKNPRAKGAKAERLCEKELIEDGWLTWRVRGATPYSKQVDMFGIWDIYAIKPIDGRTIHRYIQVKSNRRPKLLSYERWWRCYGDSHMSCEIWVKYDYKGWRKFIIGK